MLLCLLLSGNTYSIKVHAQTNKKVTLSSKSLTLAVGDIKQLKLNNSVGNISWKSSNKSVATVSTKGLVSVKGVGNASITASHKGKNYTCKVNGIKRRLNTTARKLTIYKNTEIILYVDKTKKGESLNCNVGNKKVLDINWGDWDGDDIPLTVIPLKKGKTTLTITSNESKQKLVIDVEVINQENIDDSKALTAKKIYANCAPSMVQINTSGDAGGSIGSGFFLEKGVVVTNYHVISGADTITVEDYNGKSYKVNKIIGYDKNLDIALLAVNSSNKIIPVNTHGVTMGEDSYAIGSSLGLTDTFSNGIVSNTGRVVDGITYIQTNTPISPGNSGGPLINAYGEVIGINTFTYVDGQNINMAIEITQVYKVSRTKHMSVSEFAKKSKVDTVIYEDESKSGSISTCQQTGVGNIVLGMIDNYNDVDIYSITIEEPGEYAIITYCEGACIKLFSSFYDGNGYYLEPDSYKMIDADSSYLMTRLEKGNYYVVMEVDSEYVGYLDEPLLYAFGVYKK